MTSSVSNLKNTHWEVISSHSVKTEIQSTVWTEIQVSEMGFEMDHDLIEVLNNLKC